MFSGILHFGLCSEGRGRINSGIRVSFHNLYHDVQGRLQILCYRPNDHLSAARG